MKNLLLCSVILLLSLSACDNPSKQTAKSESVSEISDTAGFYAAKNMIGLGNYKLGESTYSQVLEQIKSEIRKDSKRYSETNFKELPRYSGYEEKYPDFNYDKKGNIVSSFYREDFGSIFEEIKYDTLKEYLRDDILDREIFGCPNIKEIDMFKYYIGDIELSNFKLKFYNDTLYNVSCDQNGKIEEGFTTKYGQGKYYNNNVWKTPLGVTNKRPESDQMLKNSQLLKIDEKYVWENDLVKAESQTYCEYIYEGNEYKGGNLDSYNSYFRIYLKDKELNKHISDCTNSAYELKRKLEDQKKQNDLNKL